MAGLAATRTVLTRSLLIHMRIAPNLLIIPGGANRMASVSSLARALSQLTERSLRPGSGRDFSIWGSPHHWAVGEGFRSETLRSGDICETLNAAHRSGTGYSKTRNRTASCEWGVHAPQLSHAADCGEPIDQHASDNCKVLSNLTDWKLGTD